MKADVYLDYAAGAPLRPAALDAYARADVPGNPHALHRPARRARRALDEAREVIAAALGADPAEVVFTSGGTEADALAVQGLHAARQAPMPRPHLLVGATEHHAVLDNARLAVRRWGGTALEIPVDKSGLADVDFVADHLRRHGAETSLVSLMAANNETGALQPVAAVAALAREHGVPVHSDWAQAVGKLALDFKASGLAAASVSAHKLGGPVGIGALVLGRRLVVEPLAGGGGQERGLRSGTADARGAAAFAAALREAMAQDPSLLDALLGPLDRLIAARPELAAVSPPPGEGLPGLRCFTVAGASGEALVYLLDQAGLACSTGSACTAGVAQASHVLLAMGLGSAASSAVRVSVGHASTPDDVNALVAALPEAAQRARAAKAAGGVGDALAAGDTEGGR
ncbi:MAG: aminotransferase class V-fold PLP-dependent enzyme [Bifidobacteriaceae bacterium]|nr:aminotransferase class V-fold PLP-dependent enzyme [Bifidobacteriaceae bacterium]